MDLFITFLKMGFEHISDVKGYDHMLFIITMCAVYRPSEWKKVAVLVTAFTVGHSVTLALSALKIIVPDAGFIEVLIPVTILFTALFNIFYKSEKHSTGKIGYNYLLALIFGFVHGLGFSNFFNALMGDSINIVFPLFAFNVGLEIGQLLIVVLFFATYLLVQTFVKTEQKYWKNFFSGTGAAIALIMILERL